MESKLAISHGLIGDFSQGTFHNGRMVGKVKFKEFQDDDVRMGQLNSKGLMAGKWELRSGDYIFSDNGILISERRMDDEGNLIKEILHNDSIISVAKYYTLLSKEELIDTLDKGARIVVLDTSLHVNKMLIPHKTEEVFLQNLGGLKKEINIRNDFGRGIIVTSDYGKYIY
jgi:hypothetical protein